MTLSSTKVHNSTQMLHLAPRLLRIIRRPPTTPLASSSTKWAWTIRPCAASWASPKRPSAQQGTGLCRMGGNRRNNFKYLSAQTCLVPLFYQLLVGAGFAIKGIYLFPNTITLEEVAFIVCNPFLVATSTDGFRWQCDMIIKIFVTF